MPPTLRTAGLDRVVSGECLLTINDEDIALKKTNNLTSLMDDPYLHN